MATFYVRTLYNVDVEHEARGVLDDLLVAFVVLRVSGGGTAPASGRVFHLESEGKTVHEGDDLLGLDAAKFRNLRVVEGVHDGDDGLHGLASVLLKLLQGLKKVGVELC